MAHICVLSYFLLILVYVVTSRVQIRFVAVIMVFVTFVTVADIRAARHKIPTCIDHKITAIGIVRFEFTAALIAVGNSNVWIWI